MEYTHNHNILNIFFWRCGKIMKTYYYRLVHGKILCKEFAVKPDFNEYNIYDKQTASLVLSYKLSGRYISRLELKMIRDMIDKYGKTNEDV